MKNIFSRNLIGKYTIPTQSVIIYCQIQVKYKLCYAKLLDFRKKFLEAARRYQELSLEARLSLAEQNELLRHSVI